MIKIAEVVKDILNEDEIALEALRSGILNLSAYAENIRPQVEKILYKDIRRGSIVTALSRLSDRSKTLPSLKAPVHIEDLSIKSPLCELTYEASSNKSAKVAKMAGEYSGKGFFTVTNGVGEITIIAPQNLKIKALRFIGSDTKGEYDNLSAITVRFVEKDYLEIPNMIYTLVAAIAGRRINLIEIVSTYTEISFIVRQKNMKDLVEVLKDNFLN